MEVPQQDVDSNNAGRWTLNVDGASQQTGARVRLQLKASTGEMMEQATRLDFPKSNNETEYEVIIAGIDLATSVSSEKIIMRSDSQLLVGQVNGEYETQDQRMIKYVCLVKLRLESFVAWKLEHILRGLNERVDTLVALVASLPIKETVFLPV